MTMSVALHPLSAYDLFTALLSATCDDTQREALFIDLVRRPITADVITDGVRALRDHMIPVTLSADAIDTCGTGGSGLKTINTSTLTAFIVAAAGAKVAKHGNRSASGNCGCFDLLEALGVRIDLTLAQEQRIFDELRIVFLFAPSHHPALRAVAPLRKKYGKKTLFNLIGPLCNPAGVRQQLLGTGNDHDAALLAETLHRLGSFPSLVATGHDGLDEVSVTAVTTVRRISEKGVTSEEFDPRSLGIPLSSAEDITAGGPEDNARIFLDLLQGGGTSPQRHLVLVNAAHTLLLTPLVQNLRDAYARAEETLASGSVHDLFCVYRDFPHQS